MEFQKSNDLQKKKKSSKCEILKGVSCTTVARLRWLEEGTAYSVLRVRREVDQERHRRRVINRFFQYFLRVTLCLSIRHNGGTRVNPAGFELQSAATLHLCGRSQLVTVPHAKQSLETKAAFVSLLRA